MRSIARILARFVAATVAITFIVLIFNVVLFCAWTVNNHDNGNPEKLTKNIAQNLKVEGERYTLSSQSRVMLRDNHSWAMLIDDSGKVVWSEGLPEEIPMTYTASDIAAFSRWYLKDYPVYVWKHPKGLLVLGFPKDSYWKYPISFPIASIDSVKLWIPAIFIFNAVLAILLSLIIGFILIRSIKPLVKGICDMADGKVVRLKEKGILRDISASVNRTSDELQSQREALKKQDKARSNWIAGISHDIRTPLSMILGYASELEESDTLTCEQRKKASIVRQQGVRLRELVNDLNLVSMLEYDMQPLNVKLLKPSAIIRQVVSGIINSGLGEEYPIDIRIEDESITINGDERLLSRAIYNVVNNSIGHNPKGCSISISLARDYVSKCCNITICDDGEGVAASALKNLENLPYANGRGTYEGHGLGLPMVSRIIKAHGGEFKLSSDVGKGFRTSIQLPVTDFFTMM